MPKASPPHGIRSEKKARVSKVLLESKTPTTHDTLEWMLDHKVRFLYAPQLLYRYLSLELCNTKTSLLRTAEHTPRDVSQPRYTH
jgi:hypothetical protein